MKSRHGKHTLLVLVLILALGGCGGGEEGAERAEEGPAGSAAQPPAAGASVQLAIGGMHCQGCADAIQNALDRTEGVLQCAVSFADSLAEVTYDEQRVSPEQLVRLVEEVGYRARPKPPAGE